MRSTITDTLPAPVKRDLLKLGQDVALARKKRRLTAAMMAERIGVAKSTYLKIERGDPTVSMGAYAMTFFVLGLGGGLADVVDPRRDDQGLVLDATNAPKRIRRRRASQAL